MNNNKLTNEQLSILSPRVSATYTSKALAKADINDELVKKLDKMLKTKRATNIVNDVDRLGYNDLIKKYQLKFITKMGSDTKVRDLIRRRLCTIHNINDYTLIDERNKFAKQDQSRRTKLENERRLWKVVKSPQPKNWTGDQKKYQKKPMGLADYLHRLELYKMSKWDRKHPMPSLEFDLFPELIVAGWKTKRMLANENIRNMLSIKYCHDKRYKPEWRFFGVYQNVKTGHVFEMEPDPSVIGYPGIRASAASSVAQIADILTLYKDKAKQSCGEGTKCLKVKMYSADGTRYVVRDAA